MVVDIPKDMQFAKGAYQGPARSQHKTTARKTKGDPAAIAAAVELIAKAKRPIFYTGGGVINSGPQAQPSCCASSCA